MAITSTTGLVSGINTSDIIDQLMQIESQSKTRVETKISNQQTVKTAWMSLSASILGVQSSLGVFKDASAFKVATASSSNEMILTASAAEGATLGTFQFTVKQLAQNHQIVSNGYSARDALVGAGEISFDMGRGRLNRETELATLNGQQGVASGRIRITDRGGETATIDLTRAITVNDVVDAINQDGQLHVTASVEGDSIVLSDSSGGSSDLIVENVGTSSTATDLGLAGSWASDTVTGGDLVYLSADSAISSLNDGNGLDRIAGTDDMKFTLRDHTVFSVSLLGASNQPQDTAWTVGDIIDTINNESGGKLQASISADGNGLTLVDTTLGDGDLIVEDINGSKAASQLGLAGTYSDVAGTEIEVDGRDLIAGLNTVLLSSLDGGQGIAGGQIMLRDRLDNAVTLDLTGAQTLADVVDAINNSGVGIEASLNEQGTALVLNDTTGAEDFHMVVSDVSGDLAATLGIAVDDNVSSVTGVNAQLQYVSASTSLDEFCGDEAWSAGKIKVTTTLGETVTVNLSGSNINTVGDVITGINAMTKDKGVTARINDSGTGIILEDSNNGGVVLKVEEVDGGKTADQLHIAGSAETGEAFIDGSLRTTITIDAEDSLTDLVSKINAAGAGVSASIFSDQSSVNPYRLMLVSETSGRAGELVIDTGTTGLNLTTTSKAQDAVVFLGSGDSPVVVTSSTNQVEDVIDGVTLDLKGADDSPVTVSVARDTESITGSIESFISTFNSVISAIDSFTAYDSETQTKGVLFGNGNIQTIRSKLINMAIGRLTIESGAYSRLNEVGVSLGSGNVLEFDSAKFMEALNNDPDSVSELFTGAALTETVIEDGEEVEQDVAGTGGVGVRFNEVIDSIADQYDGLITSITESIDTKIADLEDKVDYLDVLLESKRARLENQFAAMELAISKWQSQSSSLTALSSQASASSLL